MALGVTDCSHLFELDQGMRKLSLEELVEAYVVPAMRLHHRLQMTEME